MGGVLEVQLFLENPRGDRKALFGRESSFYHPSFHFCLLFFCASCRLRPSSRAEHFTEVHQCESARKGVSALLAHWLSLPFSLRNHLGELVPTAHQDLLCGPTPARAVL